MIWAVINLEGEVLAKFDTEDKAHEFADEYGKQTGRFAFVEVERNEERSAT